MATTISALRRIVRQRLLEELALVTPGAPNVSPQGTPGAKTIGYKIVARNATGVSVASATKTITNGASTLNGTNYNQLTWTAVPGAASYDVYRVATNGVSPVTIGLIANTAAVTYNDQGAAGDASTAPTENTSGIESPFWTDEELNNILFLGCRDLWRAIVDLHQNHFATIDATNVSLVSGATQLSGVPADCYRVLSVEPRDLTVTGTSRSIVFKPKFYKSPMFQNARSRGTQAIDQVGIIYYDILNAGSPVAAPTIVTGPPVSTTMLIRLMYVNTLSATLSESDNNPIPGESDNALIAWGVAWARAKETPDRTPDAGWIAVYGNDKQSLLTSLTPRQEQEEEIVEDLFQLE